jgi:hypothetical protein
MARCFTGPESKLHAHQHAIEVSAHQGQKPRAGGKREAGNGLAGLRSGAASAWLSTTLSNPAMNSCNRVMAPSSSCIFSINFPEDRTLSGREAKSPGLRSASLSVSAQLIGPEQRKFAPRRLKPPSPSILRPWTLLCRFKLIVVPWGLKKIWMCLLVTLLSDQRDPLKSVYCATISKTAILSEYIT